MAYSVQRSFTPYVYTYYTHELHAHYGPVVVSRALSPARSDHITEGVRGEDAYARCNTYRRATRTLANFMRPGDNRLHTLA